MYGITNKFLLWWFLYFTLHNNIRAFSFSPLYGLLLFFDHMCQLLEDGAQLHNGAFNVLHGICSTLDIGVLHMTSNKGGVKKWEGDFKKNHVFTLKSQLKDIYYGQYKEMPQLDI